MFIDSHRHLDFPDLIAREAEVLEAMRVGEVSHALCVSVKLETLPAVLGLAERHDNLFASVGVHPDGDDVNEPSLEQLLEPPAIPR